MTYGFSFMGLYLHLQYYQSDWEKVYNLVTQETIYNKTDCSYVYVIVSKSPSLL